MAAETITRGTASATDLPSEGRAPARSTAASKLSRRIRRELLPPGAAEY